jgi:hypothetical protein
MPKMNTTEVDNYLLPPRMLNTQVEMVNNNIKVIKATTPIRLRTIPNDISLASLISFFYCENYNLTAWYRSILIYLTYVLFFISIQFSTPNMLHWYYRACGAIRASLSCF